MVYHCCRYFNKSYNIFDIFKPFFEALLSYKTDKMDIGKYDLLNIKLKYFEGVALQYRKEAMVKEFQSFRTNIFNPWYDWDLIVLSVIHTSISPFIHHNLFFIWDFLQQKIFCIDINLFLDFKILQMKIA